MTAVIDVLLIIEGEIATTQLIEQMLRACSAHGIRYRKRFLAQLQVDDFSDGTIPLFVRCGDPLALCWTEALARARRPYAYFIDDNFWRILGDSELARYYRHPLIRRSLEFSVSHAHKVLTNSEELASFLTRFTSSIAVLPTFFDFSLIDGVAREKTDEVRIGFAGSPSRWEDLTLVSSLIAVILERFPQVVFEFAGTMPAGINARSRVRFFSHNLDYDSYIRFQAARGWAIGLAPLLDHEANRSKTDNKYREYSACGSAGVYSNIPPYQSVVRNGITGLLVDDGEASWIDAVTFLIEHPEERMSLAQRAENDVRERYSVTKVSERWAECFKQIGRDQPSPVAPLSAVSVKIRKMYRQVERARFLISSSFYSGGFKLVARRIAAKIHKLLRD